MKFSKEKFNDSAPQGIRRKLRGHIDVLDGIDVDFRDDSYGIIAEYWYNDNLYCLYPIEKEWCEEDEVDACVSM